MRRGGRSRTAGLLAGAAALLLACSPASDGSGERAAVPSARPSQAAGPAQQLWRPAPGTAWQWQLSGPLDLGVDVPVYDVDHQTTTAAQVAALHVAGRRVVCYVSVGSSEDVRPDAGRFPPAVLGRRLDGWPDERWLDVRRRDLLAPALLPRFDLCRDKGFDAVEPDNVDGFLNDTGFPLTARDQLAFNRWVFREVRARGMSVALKNDPEQAAQLVDDVDFAVVEECARYDECEAFRPFVTAGKAVLRVEYGRSGAACGRRSPVAPAMVKRLELDAWRLPCP